MGAKASRPSRPAQALGEEPRRRLPRQGQSSATSGTQDVGQLGLLGGTAGPRGAVDGGSPPTVVRRATRRRGPAGITGHRRSGKASKSSK
eukprot:1209529-Lingulodinium_polyedra.AAC.1